MKKILSILAIGLAASALTVFAQDATSSPTSTPAGQEGHRKGGPREGLMREALESLTPAERTQFLEVRKKAMEDPTVAQAKQQADAARKESFEAMKSALLQQDPSLGPILDKLKTPQDLKSLTPEEHQKLEAARKATHPGKDALAKAMPAEKAFHEALRAAMLKIDPSIGPILDKVDAAMKEKWSEVKEKHTKNNPE